MGEDKNRLGYETWVSQMQKHPACCRNGRPGAWNFWALAWKPHSLSEVTSEAGRGHQYKTSFIRGTELTCAGSRPGGLSQRCSCSCPEAAPLTTKQQRNSTDCGFLGGPTKPPPIWGLRSDQQMTDIAISAHFYEWDVLKLI